MAASSSSEHAGDDLGNRATPLSGTQLQPARFGAYQAWPRHRLWPPMARTRRCTPRSLRRFPVEGGPDMLMVLSIDPTSCPGPSGNKRRTSRSRTQMLRPCTRRRKPSPAGGAFATRVPATTHSQRRATDRRAATSSRERDPHRSLAFGLPAGGAQTPATTSSPRRTVSLISPAPARRSCGGVGRAKTRRGLHRAHHHSGGAPRHRCRHQSANGASATGGHQRR